MRYRGTLQIRLNPPGETLAVKHEELGARLRSLFFYDSAADSYVRERFSVAEVLRKLQTVFGALEIDDLTRITQDGVDRFFDSENETGDRSASIETFLEEAGSRVDYEGPLQLVLEKSAERMDYVLRLEIRSRHALEVFPLSLAVDGLAGAELDAAAGEKEFRHFLGQIEQNIRRVFEVDEIQSRMETPANEGDPAPVPDAASCPRPDAKQARPDRTEPNGRSGAVLFPLYGVTLGLTTVDELARLGRHASDKDDDGNLYKYYVVGDMNFWYGDGRAESIYITHTDALPAPWRELGFDWDLSYDEWIVVLERLGCFISVTTPPKKVRHYSGERDSFEAGVSGLLNTEQGTLTIDLNFNYSDGTTTTDRDTLYAITMRLR